MINFYYLEKMAEFQNESIKKKANSAWKFVSLEKRKKEREEDRLSEYLPDKVRSRGFHSNV